METYISVNFVYVKNASGYLNSGTKVWVLWLRTCIQVAALVLLMSLVPGLAIAQSGLVVGKVADILTREPIAGAEVVLEDTRYRSVTNADGRFALREVPAGNFNLVVTANGYTRQNISVSVNAGDNAVQHVELSDEFQEGDAKFVVAREREISHALGRQEKSAGVSSTLTKEQMDRFADYSVQDAMARIPGVQIDHTGEVNIRGAGLNNYNVTIDGLRTGTTGIGNRSFDLGSISTNMVRKVEVIKVITPDMHADALAGSVNLVTRRPAGGDLQLGGRFGGGANPRYFIYTGPENHASLYYAQELHDDVFVSLDLNQQRDTRSWESLVLDYDQRDFGNGQVDVFERIIPGLNTTERNKLGGRLQLTYQPSEFTSIYIQGFLSNDGLISNRHRNIWDTGGDWIRADTTGAEGRRGTLTYDALLQDTKTSHYAVHTGASHIFTSFDLNYNFAWSQGRSNQSQYLFPFLADGLDFALDIENRSRPSMQVTNIRLFQDGTMERRFFNFQPVNRVENDHIDNTFTASIDVEIPFRIGSLKLGSSAVMTYKEGDFGDANFTYGRITLHRFNVIRRGDFDPLEHYLIPYTLDTENTRIFFHSSRPGFTKDVDLEHERSDIWNYQSNEQIYSGYGMSTLEAGRFTLLVGARLEHTGSSNEGNHVLINEDGEHVSTTPVSYDNSYTNLFPNAQLVFSTGSRSNVQLAWSQSIARPDFSLTAPFELVNARDSLVFRGNPELNPVTSDNLDLHFEYFYHNTGALSIGLFHKQLSGYVVERQQTITSGEYSGWQDRTFDNGDETATLYGVELSWQQNLAILPGFLRRLSTYANYTWTESAYEVGFRDGEVALPGQSPHVVNAALLYSQGRFSGQVAYHWTAVALSRLQENPVLMPSIDSGQLVYADSYLDGWTDVSASMRIRISSNFRFWADLYNLLNVERIQYDHTRDLYPREINLMGGRGFRAGIRMDL